MSSNVAGGMDRLARYFFGKEDEALFSPVLTAPFALDRGGGTRLGAFPVIPSTPGGPGADSSRDTGGRTHVTRLAPSRIACSWLGPGELVRTSGVRG